MSMPQSLARVLVHLVFSTKNREPRLVEELRPKLYAYKAGILKEWNSPAITIGGVADHVHILCVLSKNHALAKLVEEVNVEHDGWCPSLGILGVAED
jgi:REP element-mobilizing transposase RayT